MDRVSPRFLTYIISTCLITTFAFLSFLVIDEVNKKKRDEKRVETMLQIQKAIDQYYSEKQVFPFGEKQGSENYQKLMQQYIRSSVVPYDPKTEWNGNSQGHPGCYQYADGVCYGRFVFDTSGNTWYMQVKLERKTIFNGQCSFPTPTDRYCVGYQRLANPY